MRFKLVAALLCLLAPTAQAETLKVAIPQKGNWDTSVAVFGARAGIFKKEGLDLQFIYTEGGATTLQSVLSGSIDIGMQTGALGLIGAYAKGAPARVISAGATSASDLFWYSKAGSGIKNLKDVNGKTIAYSEVGSSSNLVLLSLLKQAGVNATTVRTGGVPSTFTQVMSGQIDVGWSAAPFGIADVKAGKIQIVARGADLQSMKNQTIRANFVSAGVLASKRDALVKFSRAYAESLDWVYSHPQAIQWFADGQHISPDVAKEAVEEFYPRADLQPYEIKGLDLSLQQALEYKFISHPMTPADLKGMIDILYKGNG
jgi:NitT/TauT family transport system substrate-binding protein